MDNGPDRIGSAGHLTMSDTVWEQDRLRAEVIGKLATGRAQASALSDEVAAKA